MRELYIKIRQIFQPYWKPKVKPIKPVKPKKPKKLKKQTQEDKLVTEPVTESDVDVVAAEEPERDESNTLYDRYVDSRKYEYDKKLFFLINHKFIRYMEEFEKQYILYRSEREQFVETDDSQDDFMTVKSTYEDNGLDLEDFKKHSISRIGEPMTMAIYDKDVPFDDVKNLSKLPKQDTMWYYHDKKTHQILAHLKKGTGTRNTQRSDSLRRTLKALIYPKTVGEYDRTHLISFGYHGSEGDNRIVIGWDSKQNRVLFNEFEQRQKKHPFDIYWLTKIDRTESGATWIFEIYDTRLNLVDRLESKMIAGFNWRSYSD